ncbi:MAG: hypothetical protein L0Y71_05525 [Gemmataceae bacterium]|nr:hypothetical protein [Gemmataceae bacterium]
MNFTDLFVVVAVGSGLYAVLVAVTRQRHFLVKAVNPHRLTWLIGGVSALWAGLTLMRWEAGTWDLSTWGTLFAQLISEAPTPARVKVASVALFLGLLLIALVCWCVAFYPRDPTSFRRPKDRRAALRYYVQLRGGLDFAILSLGDGEPLAEEADLRGIQAWSENLPKVKVGDEPPRSRTAQDQVEFWRQTAARIHQGMKDLDQLIATAHQGHNRRLAFDCEFGGLFFRYLRLPDPANQVDTGLYLFAATLNQMEMTNGRAEEHFQYLLEALHHVDRAVRVA